MSLPASRRVSVLPSRDSSWFCSQPPSPTHKRRGLASPKNCPGKFGGFCVVESQQVPSGSRRQQSRADSLFRWTRQQRFPLLIHRAGLWARRAAGDRGRHPLGAHRPRSSTCAPGARLGSPRTRTSEGAEQRGNAVSFHTRPWSTCRETGVAVYDSHPTRVTPFMALPSLTTLPMDFQGRIRRGPPSLPVSRLTSSFTPTAHSRPTRWFTTWGTHSAVRGLCTWGFLTSLVPLLATALRSDVPYRVPFLRSPKLGWVFLP